MLYIQLNISVFFGKRTKKTLKNAAGSENRISLPTGLQTWSTYESRIIQTKKIKHLQCVTKCNASAVLT